MGGTHAAFTGEQQTRWRVIEWRGPSDYTQGGTPEALPSPASAGAGTGTNKGAHPM